MLTQPAAAPRSETELTDEHLAKLSAIDRALARAAWNSIDDAVDTYTRCSAEYRYGLRETIRLSGCGTPLQPIYDVLAASLDFLDDNVAELPVEIITKVTKLCAAEAGDDTLKRFVEAYTGNNTGVYFELRERKLDSAPTNTWRSVLGTCSALEKKLTYYSELARELNLPPYYEDDEWPKVDELAVNS